MQFRRPLQAVLIVCTFFLCSIGSMLLVPPVAADSSTTGESVLFFKQALFLENSSEEDFDEFFGFPTVTPLYPSNTNDSQYPPSIRKDGALNSEEWLTWMTTTWVFYLFGESEEFNLSELFDFFGNESLQGYRIDLLFPHPFRIVEQYTYEGDEPVAINGDVTFDLFFDSHKRVFPKFIDSVEVGLYAINMESLFPLPKTIKNTTTQIVSKEGITQQSITIQNVQYTLQPGESLLFSIEILPSEKRLGQLVNFTKKFVNEENIAKRWEQRLNKWNQSKMEQLRNIAGFIQELQLVFQELNISVSDLTTIFEGIPAFSASLIYDSMAHPSSVTIPGQILTLDTRVYYLHADQTMDQNRPRENKTNPLPLSTTMTRWDGPALETRNKIIKIENTTVELFLSHPIFKRNIIIEVQLLDGTTVIDTSEKKLDRLGILGLFKKPTAPIVFSFNGPDYELFKGHQLSIGIAISNVTKGLHQKIKLYYDSLKYLSLARVQFEETTNINIGNITSIPADGQIVPGNTVTYTLALESKYEDTVSIRNITGNYLGDWTVTIQPESITIPAGDSADIQVLVTSEDNTKEAYGSMIDVTLIIEGSTGITRQTVSSEVSEQAIQYAIDIINYTEKKNIERGASRTYYFIIQNKNTGAIDDTDDYTITATSEHDWELLYTQHIKGLLKEQKTEAEAIQVTVTVPENTTETSDTITVTITSDSDSNAYDTVTVTVSVIGADIFGQIYEFFESLSETLGFDDVFGEYGPLMVIAILIIVIFFLLIIVALMVTRKVVKMICTDRIKEIDANEAAVFEVTLQNPSKKTATYQLGLGTTPDLSKWQVHLDTETMTLEGRQSQVVTVTVRPTETVEPSEWLELTLCATLIGKKRTDHMTLLVSMKEGTALLQITQVISWPRDFAADDKVTTAFKVVNKGTIAARNVTIFLFINGKIKNQAKVTIPAWSVADVQMPWRAVKGKNNLLIRLKE